MRDEYEPVRVLIVEPDAAIQALLADAASPFAVVDKAEEFLTARQRVLSTPYDWLVTNIRLREYNGLHFLHLASSAQLPVRMILYSDRRDLFLAREAQRAGAFYESVECVHRAVGAYLRGTLPPLDRRNAEVPDRRTLFRGGRRCVDAVRTPLAG